VTGPVRSISVLTPSYQYAQFLTTCLRSVHRQSSPFPVQHIVVDDASTDESWDIVRREHPDPRDAVRHETNIGLSRTLTEALRRATGDVVCWLNADDFHLPWTYAEVARAFTAYPGATLVYGDTAFVDDGSRLTRLVPQPAFDRRVMEGGFNMFHVPSVFFRREAVPPDFTFDETMKLYMDLDLWLTVTAGSAVIVKTDAVLSAFRRHAGQVSAVQRPSDADEVRTLSRRHTLSPLGARENGGWTRSSHVRHALGKVRDGAAVRQLLASRMRGQNLDWTKGADVPSALQPSSRGARLRSWNTGQS